MMIPIDRDRLHRRIQPFPSDTLLELEREEARVHAAITGIGIPRDRSSQQN